MPLTTIKSEYALPMQPNLFRIQQMKAETYDTFTMEIVSIDGRNPEPFKPGQFNMLYVFGTGEVPISISGDPLFQNTIVHTIRSVGAVTRAMRKMKRGDIIGVRGPFGSAWPIQEADGRDVVFVAGGIGLAPLRPALYSILANRERYGRIVLLSGSRTKEDILFRKELEGWRSRLDLDVEVTVDRSTGQWYGNVGVVTNLISKVEFDSHDTIAMVCGPEIMMRFTVQELVKRGVSEDSIYLSLERNMKCGIGLCGRCQYGPTFICKEGPVYAFPKIKELFRKREI